MFWLRFCKWVLCAHLILLGAIAISAVLGAGMWLAFSVAFRSLT
jgi:hypothetical protein